VQLLVMLRWRCVLLALFAVELVLFALVFSVDLMLLSAHLLGLLGAVDLALAVPTPLVNLTLLQLGAISQLMEGIF
jgi:hypothetical protein